MNSDKIQMMFSLMEYDYLTDAQHGFVVSLEKWFIKRGTLTDDQAEALESIFEKASEKVEWSR